MDKSTVDSLTGSGEAVATQKPAGDTSVKRVWVWMGALMLLSVSSAAWVHLRSEEPALGLKGERSSKPKPVTVARAARASLPLVAEYRGELDTEVAELAAQGSGRLQEVRVNLGDTFKEGDILGRVDAAETRRLLGEARAQAESALAAQKRNLAQLENARSEAARGEKMLAERVVSEQEVLSLKSQVSILEAESSAADAQRAAALSRVALYVEQLAQAELKAPFDGAVATRYLDAGATVAPGTPVLRLVKSGPLEVEFRASELHLSRLSPQTKLQVTTLGTGATVFEGTLTRISAEVSRNDRSVLAEGTLSKETPELRPGMYATVTVSLGTLEDAVIVPQMALTSRIDETGVAERGLYVVSDRRARYVEVTVLGEYQGKAAVDGIDAGAEVVTEGRDLLSDGALVELSGEKAQPVKEKTPPSKEKIP